MEFLDDGTPRFIYGTAWKEDRTYRLTKLALKEGFRGIDTANQRKHYHEEAVGEAITDAQDEGIADRDDLFVQTKFTYQSGQDHRLPYDPDSPVKNQVRQSLSSSLDHLNTDYIDSFVLHGPATRSGLVDKDHSVLETMQELAEDGQVESIGVSNVSAEQLEAVIDSVDRPIAFVQNRCFARTGWDTAVRDICEKNDIHYQGFSLLTANQRELQSRDIHEIAERHDKTIPQIIFRFALELGMIPLTGTTDQKHMQEDLKCFEFTLSEDDLATIEEVARS